MSTSITAPATVQIGRSRLVALVVAVAALAAVVTWAVTAFAFDSNTTSAAPSSRAAVVYNPLPPASLHGTVAAGPSSASAASAAQKVTSIMSLTPAGLADGVLGTGYALPTAQNGPTTASILASMSPKTRQYTKAIMNLTFGQLAAGAAGQP